MGDYVFFFELPLLFTPGAVKRSLVQTMATASTFATAAGWLVPAMTRDLLQVMHFARNEAIL